MRMHARALLGAGLLLAAVPPLAGLLPADHGEFLLQQITTILIAGLLAMSLDLLVGIVGLVSLGHAGFFGLAAYLLVLLTPDYEAPSLLTHVPLALAGTALAALAVGALVLRTGGVYFIMVTLAFGQMMFYLFNDSKIAGGSDGIYLYVRPALEIAGRKLVDFEDKQQFYYASLLSLVLSYLLLRMILAAPFGKVLTGIGINEGRTTSLGYATYAYKLAAFTLAGTLAGLAGILAATQYGFVNPGMLGWHQSGTVLVTVILGGMGSLLGPVLGAFAIEILRHFLEEATSHWMLPFGVLIMGLVLLLPRGLISLPARLRALVQRGGAA